MDSYVKLKERLVEITKQIETIEQGKDINFELTYIYEFYNSNQEIFQGYHLPTKEELLSENKDKLILTLNLLETFINMSDLSNEDKDFILKNISTIKESVSKQKDILEKLTKEKEKIEKLSEERKKYLLDKIGEVNACDKEITIINKRISELQENTSISDVMRNLELGKELDKRREIKSKMISLKEALRNEEHFTEDATLLAQEILAVTNKGTTDNLENTAPQEQPKESNPQEPPKEPEPKHIFRKSTLKIKDPVPYKKISDLGVDKSLLGKWVVKQEDGTYLEIDKSIEKEPAILVLPDNAIINEEKNSYDIPDNTPEEFVPDTPDFSGELEVRESYKNWILEQKVKLRKNLKAMFGILSIASKLTSKLMNRKRNKENNNTISLESIKQTQETVEKLITENLEIIEEQDAVELKTLGKELEEKSQEYASKKDNLTSEEQEEFLQELGELDANLRNKAKIVYRKICLKEQKLEEESKGKSR